MALIKQALSDISNFIKPWIRPWYGQFLLDPTIRILLKQTTVDQAYGADQIKRFLPPEKVATPETKGMPEFDKPFRYLEGSEYTTPLIYSTVVENVLYEPGNGAVLTKSRKLLSESLYPNMDAITVAGGFLNKNFIRRKFFEGPVETISGYSSIYQGLPNGYYHKIIDLVPRCFLLNHVDYAGIDQIKLLYAPPLSEVEALMVPQLVPNNVRQVCLEPGRLYHLEKLILPTFLTQFGSGYLPSGYIQALRKIFLPQRPSKRCNRIYISRRKSANTLKKRHVTNEDTLFLELQKFGFQKYCLEDFSLQEKIQLFYDAETVVGVYGGGLTHILFSDQVNVLELQIMDKMQTYYYYLAKALGHNFRFVCGNKANNRENFEVDIQKVLEVVREWHPEAERTTASFV